MLVVLSLVASTATAKIGFWVASIGTSYSSVAGMVAAFFAGTGVVAGAGGNGLLSSIFFAYTMMKIAEAVVSMCTTLRHVVTEVSALIKLVLINEASMAVYEGGKVFSRAFVLLFTIGNASAVDQDFDAVLLALNSGQVLLPSLVVTALGVTCTLIKTVIFDLNLENYHESIPVLSACCILYAAKVAVGILVSKCGARRVVA